MRCEKYYEEEKEWLERLALNGGRVSQVMALAIIKMANKEQTELLQPDEN